MIKFAIVGIGHISKKHIEAINNTKQASLVALCDTNIDRLKEYDSEYKTYTDIHKMLSENEDIDVVNICVPSGLHVKIAEICAAYKKHLIVEKPMSLKNKDAEALLNLSMENNIKLSVVHPNRFRPAIIKLKEELQKGSFGKLSHANATVRWNRNQAYYDQAPWRGTKELDGGVLMNQAIHDIDLLLWMMGPVESVQAEIETRIRRIEAEDVAVAVLKFKNGALGVIEAATTIYPKNLEESLAIFGEKGSAKISGTTANFIEVWDFEGINEEEKEKIILDIKNDPFGKPGHQWIIEDMVGAIQNDREPIVSGVDGVNVIKLINAILESAKTGKKVYL